MGALPHTRRKGSDGGTSRPGLGIALLYGDWSVVMCVRRVIVIVLAIGLFLPSTVQADETAYEVGERALGRGDYDEAREVWSAATEKSDPRIAFGLGRLLLVKGGETEIELGLKLIQMSATAGYVPAQAFMAITLLEGMYAAQDIDASVRWMQKVSRAPTAEKKRHPHQAARSLLTLSSFYGIGIPPLTRSLDRKEALLRESADMGNAAAQYFLGEYLAKGQAPFRKDLVEAHAYFVLSWKQDGGVFTPGSLNQPKRWHSARTRALAIRKKLSAKQMQRSRILIRAWMKKKEAGSFGWAFDPEKTRSSGDRKLEEIEEMHRDIAAGISSMDLDTQMPCLPMVERAARQCLQGHLASRRAAKATSRKSRMEYWTYARGRSTRVYPVRYDRLPGGLRWRILDPK